MRDQNWKEDDEGNIDRTLIDVDLFEISFVINPAYPDTDAALRSLTEWRAANDVAEDVADGGSDDTADDRIEIMKRALLLRA